MILSKGDLAETQELSSEICIIGGGPAAISVALSFSSTRHKVILIPGGGWTQTLANRDLYKGVVTQKGSHEPPEQMRRRQFGGGSAVWAGRCVPFDAIDFRPRPWVRESGWPVSYEQMLPYFQKACDVCQIGNFDFDTHTVFPGKQQEIIPGLDSVDFTSTCLERWSPPVHFAKTYKAVLENSTNIQVLLDAHALSLKMMQGNGKVTHIEVAAGERRMSISADFFVLATGGIENARLLLASANEYFPTGLGNQHDNVGRYYMTHIAGTYAKLNPYNRDKVLLDFEKDRDGVFCRRRWWMPEATQENRKLLNTIFYLSYSKSLTENRGAVFSALYKAAKTLVDLTGARKALRKIVQKTCQAPVLLGGIYKLGLPALLPSRTSRYWGLFFQAEQVPNRESRITLSPTHKDAFGVPRVEVHVAFQDIDIESLVTAHNLFAKRYEESGVGEIIYSEEGFREYLKNKLANYNSYAHHMGTTRMSADPRTGVVDKHAKVYDIDNLFVAGSSTFTTGGHANPTVTVVAQALKLADHLKAILQSKPEPVHNEEPLHNTLELAS
ncbi:GMC family oxidoreductase [Pontibacter brevis]